jgi:hypothetical protein
MQNCSRATAKSQMAVVHTTIRVYTGKILIFKRLEEYICMYKEIGK